MTDRQPSAPLQAAPLQAAALIRDIPDFPQPGIVFKDITPILSHPDALRETVDALAGEVAALGPDLVVGIESRGFLFGVPVAYKLGLGFSPVRKLGKLPYETIREDYALEYGVNTVEAHLDAVLPGQRVVIVDDLLATGGTAMATARLVERLGGVVVGYCFLIELAFLNGRAKLTDHPVVALMTY